jgi:4-amino-4-deoxy-L-arabinose transferase-like glycosyltransferase
MKTPQVTVQGKKGKDLSDWQVFCDRGVIVLILIFFFAFLPLLSSTAKPRIDEMFYTNPVIRMVQTGDYFTPYYYENPRLRKPIFIYWVLAASYKIFGINLFASRIPFFIAGCLVILLTYRLSLLFFRRKEWALIAAAVIASNLTLYHVSVRSTTDTFLCLFISISLYGFMRLILSGDKRTVNYFFAYVGAGFAAATKGGWGFVPVLFAFLFCFFRKGDTIKLRELIDVKSIAIAVFIASFWYIIAYYQHREILVQQFFADQVLERISGSKWYIVENLIVYLLAVVREFMPWSLILILLLITHRDKDMITNFFRENKEACIFILGWYLSLCLIFSFGNIQRTRYLFPSYPLVSALYAALFVTIANKGKGLSTSILKHIEWIILLVCFLYGVLLAVAGIFIDKILLAGGMLTIFVVAVLYATLFRRSSISSLLMVALCMILLFSVSENFTNPVIYNPPAPQVVHKIRKYVHVPIEIAAVDLNPKDCGQIYVLSGGNIKVNFLTNNIALDKLKQFEFLVLSGPFKEKLDLDRYFVEECGYTYKKHLKIRSLLSIRNVDDFRIFISQSKKRYYLLIKKVAP